MTTETDTTNAVRATVRKFVVDNFMFGQDDGIADDQSFLASRIVDSTGILQIVSFLESTYRIRIGDEELVPENLDSIDAITAFLRSKQAS